jgi:hypothetical protein
MAESWELFSAFVAAAIIATNKQKHLSSQPAGHTKVIKQTTVIIEARQHLCCTSG